MEQLQLQVGALTFDALADGPPDGALVILLHGFPESAAEWTALLPVLGREGWRAVAPDQRGYSPGARPEGIDAYRGAELVADVLGLADTLGHPTFHLVGHDWGALVAWQVAAHHPERLASLTIVSVPHPQAFTAAIAHDPDQQARSSYISFFRQPDAPEAAFLADDAALLRTALAEIDPAVRDQHIRVLTGPGAMTAALNYYRAMGHELAETPPVSVPTLFVWSTDDVALGRVGAEATAGFVTGPYRFEILEGVSHWIPEVAADQLGPLMLDHLRRYGSPSA